MIDKPTELQYEESVFLAGLAQHPGFPVLVNKIMKSQCEQANASVISIQPGDPNRRKMIDELQNYAYAVNQFCTRIQKDIQYHVKVASAPQQEPEKE